MLHPINLLLLLLIIALFTGNNMIALMILILWITGYVTL